MRKVYLDNAATTRLHEDVFAAMKPYLLEHYGNPSSVHSFGRQARKAVEDAREQVAAALGAEAKEIIFTSGATEANNLAIRGIARAQKKQGNHIITSAVEHHAVLDTCKALEKEGFTVTVVPVDEYGMVDPAAVEAAITDQTILVSIMLANNEVGTINPIAEIGEICRKHGVTFHTDAVQAIGNIPVDVNALNVDLLSLSGHKFYGPKGIGALYIRKGTKLDVFHFGGVQERKLRPGTENVPGIVGLGKAIELATTDLEAKAAKLRALRDKLIKGLLSIADTRLNGHPEKRLPGNVNVSIQYIE
ncbi:MAG: aminotransferase class V-fold PLP-dependent enzyme, partial [Firmicutes bacterium]|nr:aminotransferase class V-fold PLP-dependent enzyme [Bacillota bacterium]